MLFRELPGVCSVTWLSLVVDLVLKKTAKAPPTSSLMSSVTTVVRKVKTTFPALRVVIKGNVAGVADAPPRVAPYRALDRARAIGALPVTGAGSHASRVVIKGLVAGVARAPVALRGVCESARPVAALPGTGVGSWSRNRRRSSTPSFSLLVATFTSSESLKLVLTPIRAPERDHAGEGDDGQGSGADHVWWWCEVDNKSVTSSVQKDASL